jgi:B-cell receptor-associated protein 31
MIEELLASEEQIAKLKAQSNDGVRSGAKNVSEIDRLKKELEKKDRDLQALKSQTQGTNKAYDDLVEQHVRATNRPGEVKKER